MPRIAEFYGIIILMHFIQREHQPIHVHAYYQDFDACIDIDGNIIEGNLPPNAYRLVKEWIGLHKDEIKTIWETQTFHKIDPLP